MLRWFFFGFAHDPSQVHERSIDSDFLLRELKDILAQQGNIKVILMSATVDHERFVQYFNGAPLLSISGLAHPVKDLYVCLKALLNT